VSLLRNQLKVVVDGRWYYPPQTLNVRLLAVTEMSVGFLEDRIAYV